MNSRMVADAPALESWLAQASAREKPIVVGLIKEGLKNQLKEHGYVDLPISDDAIVICSLGKDTKGKPIPPIALPYFKALRWCVAIEESQWSEWLERRLIVALYRIAEPLAEIGELFRKGRKKSSGGPIRRAIERALNRDRTLKPRTLWRMFTDDPPRGWTFCDNRQGKYAAGPQGGNMSYRRFSNVAKEERDKLK